MKSVVVEADGNEWRTRRTGSGEGMRRKVGAVGAVRGRAAGQTWGRAASQTRCVCLEAEGGKRSEERGGGGRKIASAPADPWRAEQTPRGDAEELSFRNDREEEARMSGGNDGEDEE